MKKLLVIFMIILMGALAGIGLIGCARDKGDDPMPGGNGSEELPIHREEETFSYYPDLELAETIYYIDHSGRMSDTDDESRAERILYSSLNALSVQKDNKVRLYVATVGDTKLWKEQAAKEYNVNFVDFKGSAYELAKVFKQSGIITGEYLTYTYYTQSVNAATMAASVEGLLMVDVNYTANAIAQSLVMKEGFDYTDGRVSETFDRYQDQLNKKILVSQSQYKAELRDYAMAVKAPVFYANLQSGSGVALNKKIMDWAEEDVPILGWTDDEIGFVFANSQNSKITIPADWSTNLLFLSATKNLIGDSLTQTKADRSKVTAQSGKHYLTIVMSDGDNIQWFERGFNNVKYFGSEYRGAFPMNWTINPALIDLSPIIMDYYYKQATANDYFVTGPSGAGYVNTQEYKRLDLFGGRTAQYMKRTDLDVVTLLDNPASKADVGTSSNPIMDPRPNKAVLKHYAAHDSVAGGLWMISDKYREAAGDLYWVEDKPFVAFRDSIWEENPIYAARRVNKYAESSDPSKIESYTAIVIHAWSNSMMSVNTFVSHLADHVEIVNAKQFIQLISDNVPKQDVTDLDGPRYDENSEFDYTNISNDYMDLRTLYNRFPYPVSPRKWGFGTSLLPFKAWVSGEEYDSVEWFKEAGYSELGSAKLDGSDLGESSRKSQANSAIYIKTIVPSDGDKAYLMFYYNMPNTAMIKSRIVYKEDGEYITRIVLDWKQDSKTGWTPVVHEVTDLIGKEVLLIIEQGDHGQGSGEIVLIDDVEFTNNLYDPDSVEVLKGLTVGDIKGKQAVLPTSSNVFADFTQSASSWTEYHALGSNLSRDDNGFNFVSGQTSDAPQAFIWNKFRLSTSSNQPITKVSLTVGGANGNVGFRLFYIGAFGTYISQELTPREMAVSQELVTYEFNLPADIADKEGALVLALYAANNDSNARAVITNFALNISSNNKTTVDAETPLTLGEISDLATNNLKIWNFFRDTQDVHSTLQWRAKAITGETELIDLGYALKGGDSPINTLSSGASSLLYTKTRLDADSKLLSFVVRSHEQTVSEGARWRDSSVRVKIVDISDNYTVHTLVAKTGETDWINIVGPSDRLLSFDVSQFAGKEIVVIIEQGNDGIYDLEGNNKVYASGREIAAGEFIFVKSVQVS